MKLLREHLEWIPRYANGWVCWMGFSAIIVIPPTSSNNIRLTHALPINRSFKHSLNQTPPSPSTSFFHQSSRPREFVIPGRQLSAWTSYLGITLTLLNGSQKVDLRISASQTAAVQSLVNEFRRLTDLSRMFIYLGLNWLVSSCYK